MVIHKCRPGLRRPHYRREFEIQRLTDPEIQALKEFVAHVQAQMDIDRDPGPEWLGRLVRSVIHPGFRSCIRKIHNTLSPRIFSSEWLESIPMGTERRRFSEDHREDKSTSASIERGRVFKNARSRQPNGECIASLYSGYDVSDFGTRIDNDGLPNNSRKRSSPKRKTKTSRKRGSVSRR